MPGWYVIVELTNKNISDITQQFSAWGGVYGSILVGIHNAVHADHCAVGEKR